MSPLTLVLLGCLIALLVYKSKNSGMAIPTLPSAPARLPAGTEPLKAFCRYAGPHPPPFGSASGCERSLRDGLVQSGCFGSIEDAGKEVDYRVKLFLIPGRGVNALTLKLCFFGNEPETEFELKKAFSESTRPTSLADFLDGVRDAGAMLRDLPAGRQLLARQQRRPG